MRVRLTCGGWTFGLLVMMLAMGPSHVVAGVNDGLVAFYPLDGDCADASGHGNTGIEHGGLVYDTGYRGVCATFDGVDDYIELPRMVDHDFSVVFWVRTTAVAPPGDQWYQGFGMVDAEVCGSPAEGDWGIALLDYQSAQGGRVCWGSASSGTISTTEVNDDAWHAVAVTRGMDAEVTVWVDGTLEGIGSSGQHTMTAPPWIGVGNNPCDVSFNRLWFPGRIDELRFYSRLLSAFEIEALSQDFILFDDFESGDLTAWSTALP